MYRMLLVAAMLVAGPAWAQQVDVSGKDFLSGAGDAKLAQIASEAATAGKGLTVTAPDYWHAKVAAKLHAGAPNVPIHAVSGFFENVLVRVQDAKSAEPAKPVADKAVEERSAAQKAAAEKAAADKLAAEQAAQQAAARAAAERAAAEHAAAVQAAARAAAEKQAAEKAAADKAAAEKAEAARKLAEQKAAAERVAARRNAMLKNLNDGRAADGDLQVGQLQQGDVVYIDGDLRGVVRRGTSRLQFYWLQGELNLDRIELQPNGDGRYKVLRQIDTNNAPVLRTRASSAFSAQVPAAGSAARKSLQDAYADGRDVLDSLAPKDLRQGDTLYTGDAAAIVTRRVGGQMARFWLVGSLDLGQLGLKSLGANAYRVLSDTIK